MRRVVSCLRVRHWSEYLSMEVEIGMMLRSVLIASLVSSSPCFAVCSEIPNVIDTSLSGIQRAASSITLKGCRDNSRIGEQSLENLKAWAIETNCVAAQREVSEALDLLSEAKKVKTVELCRIYASGASSVGWDLEDAVTACCP